VASGQPAVIVGGPHEAVDVVLLRGWRRRHIRLLVVATPTPPLAKRLKRFLRFWLLRAVLAAVGWLPFRVAQRLGTFLGGLAFALALREREKALASLRTAFPERSEAERNSIARAAFQHLGRCAF